MHWKMIITDQGFQNPKLTSFFNVTKNGSVIFTTTACTNTTTLFYFTGWLFSVKSVFNLEIVYDIFQSLQVQRHFLLGEKVFSTLHLLRLLLFQFIRRQWTIKVSIKCINIIHIYHIIDWMFCFLWRICNIPVAVRQFEIWHYCNVSRVW